MEYRSPLALIRDIDTQVRGALNFVDVDDLPPEQRQLVALIKSEITDARLDIRDFDVAETAAQQQRLGREARNRLAGLQQHILHASEFNLFSAADVAQLSTNIQQISTHL